MGGTFRAANSTCIIMPGGLVPVDCTICCSFQPYSAFALSVAMMHRVWKCQYVSHPSHDEPNAAQTSDKASQ